jgi:aminomethyltransferase
MVVNASNREKIAAWINKRIAGRPDVHFQDWTTGIAMIAVQGPLAVELLKPIVKHDIATMKYYHATETKVGDRLAIVSRTGYTGEDGFEIMAENSVAVAVWEWILASGKDRDVLAAGLGARDTLRLEAAMPLYGHELDEEITPLEAGLGFAVNLNDRSFPGCEKLLAIKRDGPQRVRIGLELTGKRPAREHYGIYGSGQLIGEVTSGTFSPTLAKPIAMGYVPPQFAAPGTKLEIDIRGTREPATIVTLPFYRRAK